MVVARRQGSPYRNTFSVSRGRLFRVDASRLSFLSVTRRRLGAAIVACLVAWVAALLTPPLQPGPAGGLAGWPRLVLYAASGVLLAVSAPAHCSDSHIKSNPTRRGAYVLIVLGLVASVIVTVVNAARLM